MFAAVNQKYPNSIAVEPFEPRYPRPTRPVGEGHYLPPEIDARTGKVASWGSGRGAPRGLGAVVGIVQSSRGRKGVRREGVRVPRRLDKEIAERREVLVPVRLEFDVEHQRMRDTFVWNLNGARVSLIL
jgi:hypothetical protein